METGDGRHRDGGAARRDESRWLVDRGGVNDRSDTTAAGTADAVAGHAARSSRSGRSSFPHARTNPGYFPADPRVAGAGHPATDAADAGRAASAAGYARTGDPAGAADHPVE